VRVQYGDFREEYCVIKKEIEYSINFSKINVMKLGNKRDIKEISTGIITSGGNIILLDTLSFVVDYSKKRGVIEEYDIYVTEEDVLNINNFDKNSFSIKYKNDLRDSFSFVSTEYFKDVFEDTFNNSYYFTIAPLSMFGIMLFSIPYINMDLILNTKLNSFCIKNVHTDLKYKTIIKNIIMMIDKYFSVSKKFLYNDFVSFISIRNFDLWLKFINAENINESITIYYRIADIKNIINDCENTIANSLYDKKEREFFNSLIMFNNKLKPDIGGINTCLQK